MTTNNSATITVLFTDVVGSTQLRTTRGDASAHQILKKHFELVRPYIERYSGQEVKSIGDSLMVAFDSAQSAVECAVAVQRALAEHNRKMPEESVNVRMGLNTGAAIYEDGDFFGTAVNAASRIVSKAAGGQILLSEATRSAIAQSKDIALVDRGPFWLRGFPERWRLYEVLWHEEKVSTAPVPISTIERTPFVGRENERSELRRYLDQAKNGEGALVMVAGEPGVGKTRLAEEIMAEARLHGLIALIGRCYDMQGSPPYIPFVETIETATRIVKPERLREALGDSAPEVAKLMPELRRLFPDIPPPVELPPEQERHCMFNGVRDFVERAARAQPLLFVLEDLQWSDESTLHLLRHLAQRLHEMPVLMLGTYRDTEVDKSVWLARSLEELLRLHLAQRITLKRMREPTVAAMLRGCAGQEAPAPVAHMIFTETGGNPFFVEELFKHLSEEGRLFDSHGRWRSMLNMEELEVPETVRLVIEHRLERVSKGCRGTLTSACIIGRGFTFEFLKELVDLNEGELLDAVDEAEAAQLIASKIQGAKVLYTFFHDLIRQTLLGSVSPLRRQRLHLRAAQAMERFFADTLDEHAAELAYHLKEAGALADAQKTVHYLRLAGHMAYSMGAVTEAIEAYRSALSFKMADEIQAGTRYKLGLSFGLLGRFDEALDEWRKALTLYEQLGKAEVVGNVCSDISRRLLWGSRFQEALEISNRGLSALGDRVNAARCVLLAASGHVLAYVPAVGYELPHSMFTEALEMAEKLGEKQLEGPILYRKSMFHRNYWQGPEETDCALRSAKLLRAGNNRFDISNALLAAEWGLIGVGRLEEAAGVEQELESFSPATFAELNRCVLDLYSCLREIIVTGDLERLETRISTVLADSLKLHWGWIWMDYVLLGWAQFWRGKWELAEKNFRKAVEMMDPRAEGFLGYVIAPLLVFLSCSGRRDETLRLIDERRNLLPSEGQANTVGAWTMLEGVIAALATLGEYDETAKLYPLAREAIATGNLVSPSCSGLVQTLAGIAATAGKEWGLAEEHFNLALRQAHELPHVIQQPEVRRWYALMLLERQSAGDRDKARALLAEASEMYHKIGMPRHVSMAQSLLAGLAGKERAS